MTNYHPEYKPGCKLANARIVELEAENSSMADDICSLTTAHERAEKAEAERDALRDRLKRLEDTDPDTLAQFFHDAYERESVRLGYSTRVDSRTSWDKVPSLNRAVMVATAREVLAALRQPREGGEK